VPPFTGVYFVPQLHKNLLSVGKLYNEGWDVSFRDLCVLSPEGVSTTMDCVGGLFQIPVQLQAQLCDAKPVDTLDLWHQRFGHTESLTSVARPDDLVQGMVLPTVRRRESHPVCEPCALAKCRRLPFPKVSTTRADDLMEVIHTDVGGPLSFSRGGARFYVTFICDHSRLVRVVPIARKSDVVVAFRQFHEDFVLRAGLKTQTLHSDNGGEYVNAQLRDYCNEHSIQQTFTAPYSPQQNGVAERMNQTLMGMVRAMLTHSHLEKCFWAEAITTAAYISNRVRVLTHPVSGEPTTPMGMWIGAIPDVSMMRTLGVLRTCLCLKRGVYLSWRIVAGSVFSWAIVRSRNATGSWS
jgi:transposase InsO family protein